ncbi:MAG: glutamine amidotransferase [Sediminicola sp.]|jgi:glutamine amidotransferase
MSKSKKVVIIDYQLGNLFSVKQACDAVGINAELSHDKEAIASADAIILPGVGAFKEAMENLSKLELVSSLREFASTMKPVFGVCLGQQLLFTESEEFENCYGLDLIPGVIKRFDNLNASPKFKVPQIGWNQIEVPNKREWDNTPLQSLNAKEFMYFVHSYYVKPENDDVVCSNTNYGNVSYCSSVLHSNIFSTQFHPEKSGEKGLTIYKNWAIQNNII